MWKLCENEKIFYNNICFLCYIYIFITQFMKIFIISVMEVLTMAVEGAVFPHWGDFGDLSITFYRAKIVC